MNETAPPPAAAALGTATATTNTAAVVVALDTIETDVRDWLQINRLSIYADQFIGEGYDDMETVCEMNFEDLMLIEGMKRGHARRSLKVIRLMHV